MMVDHGTIISLTQTPANLSVFAGWGGACSGTASCMVTVTSPTMISANFALDNLTLFVSKGGNGDGTVTATGINCGTDCSESYTAGQMVMLTAVASTGSTFTGWSGAGCSGTSTCIVTIAAATTVTATFTLQQYALSVARAGNGTGTVVSTPPGIACGTDCMESYDYNTMVTLTATPSAGSMFSGWSGACAGTAMCVVTMSQARSVTATFALQQFVLTASVTGNGAIASSPAGISCGADCTESYTYGQVVTLTATAGTGSTFAGWGGACAGTTSCAVTIDAAKAVTATFTLNTYSLSVVTAGNGTGTVTGTGIDCGVDCTETYPFGTMVTLTAAPATGSTFAGWSGACTGTGACTLTIDAAKSVTATFTLQRFTLTAARTGNGTGAIGSAPAGITCGGDCNEMYDYNTSVMLTATPATGSTFTGWSGACTGTGACNVTMTQDRSVTATFTLMQFPLTVVRAGSGTGTVTSSPVGIDCPTTCSQNIDYMTTVVLTATPSSPGSTFGGWSGGGCSGTGTCTVTIIAAASVTATFNVASYALDVTRAGTGGGMVTSSPAGISCPTTCSASFAFPTSVTLTATADTVSDFAGWTGGGCSGTGTCTVTMTAARSVTATFDKKPRTLSIVFSGDGAGTVIANGQSCNATCNLTFPDGTPLTILASASKLDSSASTFQGWTGANCSGTGQCTFTITGNTTVDAKFRLDPNLMFTTSVKYDGNLGGLAGADAKCQQLATTAGLSGNYRAYLSATGVIAWTRFQNVSGWTRVDGKPIVQSILDFGSTTLPNAPELDEAGNNLFATHDVRVWTATQSNGFYAGENCNQGGQQPNWSSTVGQAVTGICLNVDSTVLISNAPRVCTESYRLYCFGTDRLATVP
ncbi:MAG: InlB B-repeat-containing protein [Myxococcales bacterium]|nr:InlB B-repeat-containing protein [Myxococcales bacterium]